MNEDRSLPAASVPLWRRLHWHTLAGYALALFLCFLVLGWVYDLRRDVRNMPYYYQGDTMFYHITTKALSDNGWYQDIPLLGAPGTLNLREVPTSDNNFHFILQKLFTLKTKHYLSVLNNFYLLGFPLVMLCALFALRQLGLSWLVGTALSLLYTFLPYHIIRGQQHLFLSAYWQVPLFILALLWIARGELTWRDWRTWRFGYALVVAALLGSSGFYYAFFACFFLLAVAAMQLWQRRQWHCLILPAALIGLITAFLLANLWPSIRYAQENGASIAMSRLPADADMYGLRLAQIVLPVSFHRWQWLAELKTKYNQRLMINENDDASLGFVGALGFLGLLGWFLVRRPALSQLDEPGALGLFNHLSMLTLLGFLLATMGGFGSLVALFGLNQLRAYNRISIFLGFFSLLAVGLWLEQFQAWLAQRFSGARWLPLAFAGFMISLVWLGLLDQISPYYLPHYQTARLEYESDANLVKQIEATVPHGAMIFQLPVMSFHENPKIMRMFDYDLGRPYLHSQHLRWSYGTIKGREPDFWQRQVASLPSPELAETLALAGFSGILIDRYGYADNAEKYEAEFKALLNVIPVNAPNSRLVFFDLTAYANRLREQASPAQWQAKQEAVRHPVIALWLEGFSDQEGTPDKDWRWCGALGRLQLVNHSTRPQEFMLEMSLASDHDGTVQISGFMQQEFKVSRIATTYSQRLTIPPGVHTVNFSSDASRVFMPNEFRELVFRVHQFKLKPVNIAQQ